MENTMGFVALLKQAIERYRKTWDRFAKLYLLIFAIGAGAAALALLAAVVIGISDFDEGSGIVLAVMIGIGGVIVIVAQAWLTASLYRFTLSPETLGISEALRKGWAQVWSALLLMILVGLIVLGGLILLIIPGIIWAVRYSMTLWVLVDEGGTGRAALRRSAELVKGDWAHVFLMALIIGILGSLIGSFVSGLAELFKEEAVLLSGTLSLVSFLLQAFVIGPVTLLFFRGLYEDLKRRKSAMPAPAVPPAIPAHEKPAS